MSPSSPSFSTASNQPPSIAFPKRTHTCGALRLEHESSSVVLNGWVESLRTHGGLTFLDLRDRYGITQVVLDPAGSFSSDPKALRAEFVVAVKGKVRARPDGMRNPKLSTGDIEVLAEDISILNEARVPPFEISRADTEPGEEVRLRYRYLDLRRRAMQKNLLCRSAIVRTMREFLNSEGFLDLETPPSDEKHAGGSPRLPRAGQKPRRKVFRAAPVASALQTAFHDLGVRPLLPDREVPAR
jgi:aspartyl-tRNA synthetase